MPPRKRRLPVEPADSHAKQPSKKIAGSRSEHPRGVVEAASTAGGPEQSSESTQRHPKQSNKTAVAQKGSATSRELPLKDQPSSFSLPDDTWGTLPVTVPRILKLESVRYRPIKGEAYESYRDGSKALSKHKGFLDMEVKEKTEIKSQKDLRKAYVDYLVRADRDLNELLEGLDSGNRRSPTEADIISVRTEIAELLQYVSDVQHSRKVRVRRTVTTAIDKGPVVKLFPQAKRINESIRAIGKETEDEIRRKIVGRLRKQVSVFRLEYERHRPILEAGGSGNEPDPDQEDAIGEIKRTYAQVHPNVKLRASSS